MVKPIHFSLQTKSKNTHNVQNQYIPWLLIMYEYYYINILMFRLEPFLASYRKTNDYLDSFYGLTSNLFTHCIKPYTFNVRPMCSVIIKVIH